VLDIRLDRSTIAGLWVPEIRFRLVTCRFVGDRLGVGCENSITPLTSSFVLALTDPNQPQESQNSQRELRHACGCPKLGHAPDQSFLGASW
jgi:hypothetical protein